MITPAIQRNLRMSPENYCYKRVILKDYLFATGMVGICASLLIEKSHSGREIQVIVGSPVRLTEGPVARVAKELTKSFRLRGGWGITTVHVKPIKFPELPPLGEPQYTKGEVIAWIAE